MDIGFGHWVFAIIFAIVFIGFLIWAYKDDLKMHKRYYQGSGVFLLSVVLLIFIFWIFRGAFQ